MLPSTGLKQPTAEKLDRRAVVASSIDFKLKPVAAIFVRPGHALSGGAETPGITVIRRRIQANGTVTGTLQPPVTPVGRCSGKKMNEPRQIGEHESKFTLPNHRAVLLWSWLNKRCRPDPLYSEGLVSSIYFDTRDMEMLDDKLNSTYLKTKIRLRWYSTVADGTPFPAVFLEVKEKVGSARVKKRMKMDFEAAEVVERDLTDQFYRRINELLIRQGLYIGHMVFPVMQINYRRTRYLDPHTGARISLDRDINSSRVNWGVINRLNRRALPQAVLEYKNKSGILPEQLHQVTALGECRKGAFSKYSACYAQLSNDNRY